MPIYKYTMKKYLKSSSTWVIAVITLLLIIILVGVVALSSSNIKRPIHYAIVSFAVISSMATFLAIFTSIFAGFKAATMFKDEVEDGTFLVMLSKPISRSKIIFFKWLSLMTILFSYTFLVSLTLGLTLVIFDRGASMGNLTIGLLKLSTLSSKAPIIALFIWMILMVMSLIFSSIAILISTKLSVGATIGLLIGAGTAIPITGMVGMFSRESEFIPIVNDDINILKEAYKKLPFPIEIKDTDENPTLENVALYSGNKDSYKNTWWTDINFQINTLASFALDNLLPQGTAAVIQTSTGNNQIVGIIPTKYVETRKIDFDKMNIEPSIESKKQVAFNHLIANTWEQTEILRGAITGMWLEILAAKDVVSSKVILGEGLEIENSDTLQKLTKYFNIHKATNIIKDGVFYKMDDEFIQNYVEKGKPIARGEETNKERIANYHLLSEYVMYAFNKFKTIDDKADKAKEDKEKELVDSANNTGKNYAADTQSPHISQEARKLYDSFGKLYKIDLIAAYKRLLNPLSAINTTMVFKTRKDLELPRSNWNYKVGDSKNLSPALYIIDAKESMLTQIYAPVVDLLNRGYELTKVEPQKYADKFTILYIYLAVAFGLLPITFLVIRKQDFR